MHVISAIYDLTRRQTTFADIAAVIERSRAEEMSCTVLDNFTARTLASGETLKFTLKLRNLLGADPLISVSLTLADVVGSTNVYQQIFDAVTTGVNAALGTASDSTVTSVRCSGQFSFQPSANADWQDGDIFDVLLVKPVRSDTDLTPDSVPTPDDVWLAHGHSQTLSSGQKTQCLANLGISISSTGLLTLPGGYTIYLNAP
jgi:hypothetical protein